MTTKNETLLERGKEYGKYEGYAHLYSGIHKLVENERGDLPPVQQASFDMITSKLCRILNGNPSYLDNWRDIVGYAQLVLDYLEEQPLAIDSKAVKTIRTKKGWIDFDEFKNKTNEVVKEDNHFKSLSEAWKSEIAGVD